MHLILKRFLAWMFDWLVIMVYACALFGAVMLLASLNIVTIGAVHPVKGQLIGFFTLTLPVVLYCIVMEYGSRHATIGKRIMKITVSGKTGTGNIVLRNIIKFLPWEFAHAGVLWINYIGDAEPPMWIWALLIVPQILVVIYLVSIIYTKGTRSLYDILSGTQISSA
jgi:uncharacterized RDD family membrane protein YckC